MLSVQGFVAFFPISYFLRRQQPLKAFWDFVWHLIEGGYRKNQIFYNHFVISGATSCHGTYFKSGETVGLGVTVCLSQIPEPFFFACFVRQTIRTIYHGLFKAAAAQIFTCRVAYGLPA